VSHGVSFINILLAVFARPDTESEEKNGNLIVFFVHSGSVRVKAARRMLMKLTHGVCFTNTFPQSHVLEHT